MADTKISALTELTQPNTGDWIPVVDSNTSPITTKKMNWLSARRGVVLAADYGCKGNGSDNDSTNLQSAIDALDGAGGQILLLVGLEGNSFLLNTGLTVSGPINIYGVGARTGGSVLRAGTADMTILSITKSTSFTERLVFRDFMLRGSGVDGVTGLKVANGNNGCYFNNIVSYQVEIGFELSGSQFNTYDTCIAQDDGSSTGTSVGWYIHPDTGQDNSTGIMGGGNSNVFTNCTARSFDVGILLDGLPAPYWQATTAYSLNEIVHATGDAYPANYFRCTTAGTSGGSEPTWNTTSDSPITTSDGTAEWTAIATTPFHDNQFLSTVIQSNNYCGVYARFADRSVRFINPTFEDNANSSGSITWDTDHTIDDSIINLADYSELTFHDMNWSENQNPGVILSNNSVITMDSFNGAACLFEQDDSSEIIFKGVIHYSANALAYVPRNITYDAEFRPLNTTSTASKSAFASNGLSVIDRSIFNTVAVDTTNHANPMMPRLLLTGVSNQPTLGHSYDDIMGPVRTVAYTYTGGTGAFNSSAVLIDLKPTSLSAAGTRCCCSFLLKSDIDCEIGIYAWLGNISADLVMEAGRIYRLFLYNYTSATNRESRVRLFSNPNAISPLTTPTISLCRLQACDNEEAEWHEGIPALVARGHFNPKQDDNYWHNNTAPTSGSWPVGSIVINDTPQAGDDPASSPAQGVGWVCVTASPNTWKPYGAIAS